MFTLVGTCKLKHIDPQAWLAHVLARLPDHSVSRVAELLPWILDLPPIAAAA